MKDYEKVPFIEIFGIKNLPFESEKLEKKLTDAIGWLRSLNIDMNHNPFAFGNRKLSFLLYEKIDKKVNPAHRVILYHHQYLKDVNIDSYGGSEKHALMHELNYILNSLLPGVVILNFLESIKESLEKSRLKVFEQIKERRISLKFKNALKLNLLVQRMNLFLERLNLEYNQYRKHFEYNSGHAQELIRNNSIIKDNKSLHDVIHDGIIEQIKFLDSHIKLIKKMLTEFVDVKNIEVMYKIQRRILWLTVAVLIATLVGLITNWNTIKNVWESVVK